MTSKDICHRTFDLALRVVKLCQYLDEQSGSLKTLGKQLLRSGTSIGANVEEAQAAQSKADFVSKMNIALKEARETRLLGLQTETEEVTRIMGAIIANSKKNNTQP
jgi:four helix bundle protein